MGPACPAPGCVRLVRRPVVAARSAPPRCYLGGGAEKSRGEAQIKGLFLRAFGAGLRFGGGGGASRNRTDDLYNAIVALSQLSYGPECFLRLGFALPAGPSPERGRKGGGFGR